MRNTGRMMRRKTRMWKHYVIHKTGSTRRIATLSEEDQATAILNIHINWWSSPVWFLRHARGHTVSEYLLGPKGGVRSIVMSMSVCLSARITQKPHGRTSANFCAFHLGPGSVLLYNGVAIRRVLPVLWMTSCFHITVLRCVVFPGDDRKRQAQQPRF